MKLFNKLQKDGYDNTIPLAQSIDEKGNTIQMIQAEVIEVGPEVTDEEVEEKEVNVNKKQGKNHKQKYKPTRFSYRYRFIDPETGATKTAYDDLITVQVGEQIYDVGEKLYILYSNTPNKESGENFTVTRKIVFPEVVSKKKRIAKIGKIIYLIIVFGLVFICMCTSISNQEIVDNSTLNEEEAQELIEDNLNNLEK